MQAYLISVSVNLIMLSHPSKFYFHPISLNLKILKGCIYLGLLRLQRLHLSLIIMIETGVIKINLRLQNDYPQLWPTKTYSSNKYQLIDPKDSTPIELD